MLAAIFACYFLSFSSPVEANSNWIGLYQDTHFRGLVQSLRDVKLQTCYNLLCDGVNNEVSSASWLGFAEKASSDGLPQITFFMDKDCAGSSQGYQASEANYPSDFSVAGMDNKITSLIVYDRNVVDVDNTETFCQGSTELARVGRVTKATN
ncbi:hypothetical protein PHYPSEUDO_004785 [Phytophthora pseudosyringae]|uniref:Uncharacterized protein n=1 Tax=Phytophthora pseudosyringae TaxID=221518 RepID=A0A8T1VQJ7_9STRA|nr:hypothetical protein PHYPSEUDO_004785 [Phytophthora pseudosyringae]